MTNNNTVDKQTISDDELNEEWRQTFEEELARVRSDFDERLTELRLLMGTSNSKEE